MVAKGNIFIIIIIKNKVLSKSKEGQKSKEHSAVTVSTIQHATTHLLYLLTELPANKKAQSALFCLQQALNFK